MSTRMVRVTDHEQFKREAWEHDRDEIEREREGPIRRRQLYRRTCSRIVHPLILAGMIDIICDKCSVQTVAQLISVPSVVFVYV
jgi:hypothetical protein